MTEVDKDPTNKSSDSGVFTEAQFYGEVITCALLKLASSSYCLESH